MKEKSIFNKKNSSEAKKKEQQRIEGEKLVYFYLIKYWTISNAARREADKLFGLRNFFSAEKKKP